MLATAATLKEAVVQEVLVAILAQLAVIAVKMALDRLVDWLTPAPV